MLVHFDKPASAKEIKESLESNDPSVKTQGMQKAVSMLLNGESLPALFITILQHVLPSQDHTVQKLLLLYLVRDPLPPNEGCVGCEVTGLPVERGCSGDWDA